MNDQVTQAEPETEETVTMFCSKVSGMFYTSDGAAGDCRMQQVPRSRYPSIFLAIGKWRRDPRVAARGPRP